MEINVYDMLIFEDKAGSIYQDCVCDIVNRPWDIEINTNCFTLHIDVDKTKIIDIITRSIIDDRAEGYKRYRNDLTLKEVWSRTQSHTYRKVYELIDSEMIHIGYYNGMPVYNKRTEVTFDQIKKFVVEE